ncbi:unnamed protein product [Closterium sp. Yama58-4]|nr:unnamed protein product [Closterium sp. Yama58-4]
MCLLVHINGMAWLADVSTPCCPSSLLPHAMFLQPLLFQPGILQHQDAGVYRISPCPPPHPPAPASAARWEHGRGADGWEKAAAAVAAADRGTEGWRAVERRVHGLAVEHVEAGMDGCMAEGTAGWHAHPSSDTNDDDDDDDDFYMQGVRVEATACPPRLSHATGGQVEAAAVRAGEQWYAVERLCRVGPSEAGGRWAGEDGEQAAWGEAACEEEARWQALYRFSSWPGDADHFLQCMRHASPLSGPRVAVRLCGDGEGEGEGGGRGVIREMIHDRHLLLLDGDGRVQQQQQLATDEEFSAVVRGRFGIRLGADDVIAMPPVRREPPLGDACPMRDVPCPMRAGKGGSIRGVVTGELLLSHRPSTAPCLPPPPLASLHRPLPPSTAPCLPPPPLASLHRPLPPSTAPCLPPPPLASLCHPLPPRQRVAVLTGAGLSAASGVPTFRGAGGLWRTYDATVGAMPRWVPCHGGCHAMVLVDGGLWGITRIACHCAALTRPCQMPILFPPSCFTRPRSSRPLRTSHPWCPQELATPQAFAADPSLVWEFYHYRRSVVARCAPNAGHRALVQLEQRCQREGKAFTLLTQNVDGLHTAAGSSALVELHGCLWRTRCLTCGDITENRTQPICAALEGKGAPSEGAKAASIPLKDLPRCTKLPEGVASGRACNGLLRPDVVWFGECLDQRVVQEAEGAMTGCDLLLVVGTSGVVHPAAGYVRAVRAAGWQVAEFNAEATALSPLATWKFPGDSATLLPLVLGVNGRGGGDNSVNRPEFATRNC